MSFVVCKLPKAGLGNQLFPLLRAHVFAHLNQLPIVVIGYHQLKIGPYLRRERSKRSYSSIFTFRKNVFGELFDRLRVKRILRNKKLVIDPILRIETFNSKEVFLFNRTPHWSNYFEYLNAHRELVIKLFWNLVRSNVIRKIESLEKPIIGVHVRMGDFRKLAVNEDFSEVGTVRTPEKYFTDVINGIRTMHGTALPVSIFTDGHKSELGSLLTLENTTLVQGNSDFEDLLLLSKSKIIVVSAGSTFGYWAGFISEAPIIMHPDHIHLPLRSKAMGMNIYEGAMNKNDEVLIRNIEAI